METQLAPPLACQSTHWITPLEIIDRGDTDMLRRFAQRSCVIAKRDPMARGDDVELSTISRWV
jgi:hypothetical protein